MNSRGGFFINGRNDLDVFEGFLKQRDKGDTK